MHNRGMKVFMSLRVTFALPVHPKWSFANSLLFAEFLYFSEIRLERCLGFSLCYLQSRLAIAETYLQTGRSAQLPQVLDKQNMLLKNHGVTSYVFPSATVRCRTFRVFFVTG